MITYTAIDGHNHTWDDLGDALRTLGFCYLRMIRVAITGR